MRSLTKLKSYIVRNWVVSGFSDIHTVTGLQDLDMSGRVFEDVPLTISLLECLTSLHLSGSFMTLPDIFDSFADLNTFSIHAPIQELPWSLLELPKLKTLRIPQGVRWRRPEPNFPNHEEQSLHLPSIQRIDVNFPGHPDQQFPNPLDVLPRLQHLTITPTLPSTITVATNLLSLCIRDGLLTHLPQSITNLPLKQLRLERCLHLANIPPSIQHLSQLEDLVIHDCPNIQQLPDTITTMEKLSAIVIAGTGYDSKLCQQIHPPVLDCLPDRLLQLPALHTLILTNLPSSTSIPVPETYSASLTVSTNTSLYNVLCCYCHSLQV